MQPYAATPSIGIIHGKRNKDLESRILIAALQTEDPKMGSYPENILE
jgi:hypothetical protein